MPRPPFTAIPSADLTPLLLFAPSDQGVWLRSRGLHARNRRVPDDEAHRHLDQLDVFLSGHRFLSLFFVFLCIWVLSRLYLGTGLISISCLLKLKMTRP